MTKISKEEVKKLASMSKLYIAEKDLEEIQQQLSDVIDYVVRVQLIAKDIEIHSSKNINHDRDDIAKQGSVADILAQAPQQEDNYFVVPKIIDEQ